MRDMGAVQGGASATPRYYAGLHADAKEAAGAGLLWLWVKSQGTTDWNVSFESLSQCWGTQF